VLYVEKYNKEVLSPEIPVDLSESEDLPEDKQND
jgi:hypothetical protein